GYLPGRDWLRRRARSSGARERLPVKARIACAGLWAASLLACGTPPAGAGGRGSGRRWCGRSGGRGADHGRELRIGHDGRDERFELLGLDRVERRVVVLGTGRFGFLVDIIGRRQRIDELLRSGASASSASSTGVSTSTSTGTGGTCQDPATDCT